MRKIKFRNKKAAFEMSMSTIVIIVLAVVFLILGLALLRNIFFSATKSVNILDGKLESEIQKIFTDENKNLVIYLGEDKTARIRSGTTDFGIGVVSQTLNNVRINSLSEVQYKLELAEDSASDCVKLLTKSYTEKLFNNKFGVWLDSTGADGPISKFQIKISIPAATRICKQRVIVTAIDKTAVTAGETIAIDSFYIEVLKKGLF